MKRLLFDLRAARVAEPEELGGLVEGLADCVVHRRADLDVIADPAHRHDPGVAAGGEKQTIGELRIVGEA